MIVGMLSRMQVSTSVKSKAGKSPETWRQLNLGKVCKCSRTSQIHGWQLLRDESSQVRPHYFKGPE
ncbi:unnamed protein product, partial [Amoebophrya sp. A25]|eukprot:GSA25T00015908001.1